MNALFLKDLADKTRRGLRGRVEAGKSGGGLCYGYEVVKQTDSTGEPVCGGRRIVPEAAEIVRRIFHEFVSGISPRRIAFGLNKDSVPGPDGSAWGDTTIRGHVSRGTGVLNNELYAGRMVWNRQRYIKDPSTGRRVSRPNPPHEWVTVDVPDLRIVEDDLWQRARRHQAALAKVFEATTKGVREARAKARSGLRRPSYMLSGLLICGCCGGKYGLVVGDRYGCLNRHRRNMCENSRTIRRALIEERALTGLKEKLVSADAVAEAVRAYHEAMNRDKQEQRAQSSADRHTLTKVERSINSIIAAIEDGMYQPSMKARMNDLEKQKAEITARIAVEIPPLPDVNPNIAEIYRHKVQQLGVALNDPKTSQEATSAIRSLIGEIVLKPGDKRGEVHATLRGELMSILDFAAGRNEKRTNVPGVITAVASSPRNHH
jgi:site-specific DNA recombinase